MRALARGSMRPHSIRSAALWSGVVLFTEKSIGIDSLWMPSELGASSVTFGSWPRNAERRNLKLPLETRRSVHARMADFRSFTMSICWGVTPVRPWIRAARTCEVALTTMSTSGTATPNAVPRSRSPLAKAVTSTSGMLGTRVLRTNSASCCTIRSPSGVGEIWLSSSSTWESQLLARRLRGAIGWLLGWRNSCLWAVATAGVCGEPRAAGCVGRRDAGNDFGRGGVEATTWPPLKFSPDGDLRRGASCRPWISAYATAPTSAKATCESSKGDVTMSRETTRIAMAFVPICWLPLG
mmetsp:Transcript_60435/g.177252  ORF Transcript_60435/g.177252 Transcript_60435/m.177252 type:complete len:296 (+) Transcript_60435:526-1413(+)